MNKMFYKKVADANYSSAMELRPLQKRVSTKNHKSSIKLLIFTALFTVMSAGFSSCEKKDNAETVNKEMIIGKWKVTYLAGLDNSEKELYSEKVPRNAGYIFGAGGKLTVFESSETAEGRYTLAGKTLTIIDDEEKDEQIFTVAKLTDSDLWLEEYENYGEYSNFKCYRMKFEKVVPLPDNNTGTSLLVGTWMPNAGNGSGGEFKYVFKNNGTFEAYEFDGNIDYLFDSGTWTYQNEMLTLAGEYLKVSFAVTQLTSTKLVFTRTLYGQIYISTFNRIK